MSFELSKTAQQTIAEIQKRYPNKRAALLPILYVVQEEFGYIPEEAEAVVAAIVEVPPVKVREVISFYTLFHRKEIGKYHFQVCRTVSCSLRGAAEIMHYIEEKLHIRDGETTADRKFTFTEVECLGACELAPMMQLNDEYIGPLTHEKIDEIIANLK